MGKGKAWSEVALAKARGYISDGVVPKAIVEANPTWPLSSVKKLVMRLKAEKPVGSWKGRVTLGRPSRQGESDDHLGGAAGRSHASQPS